MVIFGGMGRLYGAIIGAMAYLTLESCSPTIRSTGR